MICWIATFFGGTKVISNSRIWDLIKKKKEEWVDVDRVMHSSQYFENVSVEVAILSYTSLIMTLL